ncbi:extracellular solute-binding protein [Cohnella nanjingensis]|uniref:Extracellular solute-binding protein n=1 Tax=Cohnella nanjingensis TaxID=1387779 RepID=A0A7X0VF31_9BACL|nr:extracellular solute-binding protein [Cohnella nanjingensis]MBB6670853.1 extracellular solute-binding protein [Cohnella nanjingensis]
MRKKRVQKSGVILLVLAMIATMLAACSSNKENGKASESSTVQGGETATAKQQTDSKEKTVKFSYVRPVWGAATYTKGGAYEKEMFKQANAEIDVQIIPVTEYDQKIMTIIASGDIPDVFWAAGPTDKKFKDMQDQGAFLKINEYLDKYPAIKEAVPQSVWDTLTDDKGNIYFIPNVSNPLIPIFMYYRQDIFENLGIPEPKTVKELEDALVKIKQSDSKMIPLTGQDTIWGLGALSTSFGFTQFGWGPATGEDKDNPNTIVPFYLAKGMKEYYFYLKKLRSNGLLDKEFLMAKNWDHAKQKFTSGQAAVLGINWGYGPEIYSTLKKTHPEAKIGILPPLEGPDGAMGGMRPFGAWDRGMYINAKMDDPDGFFRFLNWTLTEGSDFRRYGIEGKTYEVVDGKKMPLADDRTEADYKIGQIEPLKFLQPMSEALDWDTIEATYEGSGVGEAFADAKAKFKEYNAVQYPDYRNYTIFSPLEVEQGAQLYTDYLQSVIDGAIINDKVTEKEWDAAIDKYLKAGGQKIVDEVNELQKNKSKPKY